MSLKVFIDTNVYLNSLENRDNGISTDVLDFLSSTDSPIFLNDLSIMNIHYIAKKNHSKEIISENLKNILQIHNLVLIDKEIIIDALNSDFKDFEDAVQYFCAKKIEASIIITSNIKDFKNSDILVLTPNDFYNKFMK